MASPEKLKDEFNKNNFYNVITLFNQKIKESNLITNEDYIFAFKSYLKLYNFTEASKLLNQIQNLNNNSNNYYSLRDILNSKMNDRYTYKINNISQNLVKPIIKINKYRLCYKAKELVDYDLCFTFNSEQHNYSKEITVAIEYKNISNQTQKQNFVTIKCNSDKEYHLHINCLITNRIGIVNNENEIKWIFSFTTIISWGVIQGQNGWLFLDNDSNESINQFKGNKLIDQSNILLWIDYFKRVTEIKNCILLIPPSKESVFTDFYPINKGKKRPIDQIVDILKQFNITYEYPIDELKLEPLSYAKTETHWSHLAADKVIINLFKKIDHNFVNYTSPFKFKPVEWLGDLGSKLPTYQYSEYWIYDKTLNKEEVFFNFEATVPGVIRKYTNTAAFSDKKLLIFGGSSSYVCLESYIALFKHVTLIWTNGSIIEEIIDFEQPDYVILQINERFIIKSPVIFKRLVDFDPFFRTDFFRFKVYERLCNYEKRNDLGIYSIYAKQFKEIILNQKNKLFGLSDNLKDCILKNKLFDEHFYSEEYNISPTENMSLLEHYLIIGWRKGYNPSTIFDTNFYLETYSDVKNSGICPLIHFVYYGNGEGRKRLP